LVVDNYVGGIKTHHDKLYTFNFLGHQKIKVVLTFNEIPVSCSNSLRLKQILILVGKLRDQKLRAKGDIDADVTTNMAQKGKIGVPKMKRDIDVGES